MKTNLLTIVLAVALLLSPMAFIAPARAQGMDVYASEVELELENGTVKYKLPTLINMETGGTFVYNGITYTIKPNDGAVYDAGGTTQVGLVTQTKYYTEPSETAELVVKLDFYDVIDGSWYDPEVYAFQYKLGDGDKTWLSEPYKLNEDGKPDADGTITIDGKTYYIKAGDLTLYNPESNKAGELTTVGYKVRTEDEVYATVTLSTTGEPVGNATVSWVGDPQTTDAFGETGAFVAPFRESPKNYGTVRAVKEYGTNTTVRRSVYGESAWPIIVWPYDLSNPSEFLAWWSHFALTEEAQAMYEAAEILGEWGANLGTDGVTVWSNIFGPKGGSLATFIRDFPQFMVDRGAALEATQNMLDTIWALFTLVPAFVLASPQLLQTAPMRMLQFWPALFINLDLVLDGISEMVIDLGLFMLSLAPSVLLLLPDIMARIPALVPQAADITLTTLQIFIDVIPALFQYGAAALAAIPAFLIQMLQALYYNAPNIFGTAMDEFVSTFSNLFRSWPLFFAGMAAGILAVAPALMMLPSYAPLVVGGQMLENLAASLSIYMQQLREMPSRLLDSVMSLAEVPGMIPRYVLTGVYLVCFAAPMFFVPGVFALGLLGLSLAPLLLLGFALTFIPVLAICSVIPIVGIPVRVIVGPLWALWMGVSIIAAFAANVASGLADALGDVVNRGLQLCTIPGYAVGWCLQGVLDIVGISFASDLTAMLKDIVAEFPEIIAYIMPIIQGIIDAVIKSIGTTVGTTAETFVRVASPI